MAPDLSSFLIEKSLGTASGDHHRCASCRRTPLTGEHLYVLESERTICALCMAGMPEEGQRTIRVERVHASERHVAVGPRAA